VKEACAPEVALAGQNNPENLLLAIDANSVMR
jgi:hypothetical protein